MVAIGYSNGANIAASLLFHYEDALAGAILHHPMVPRRDIELPTLSSIPVFIGAGTNDPMCTAQESEDLEALLSSAGADVTTVWFNYGHQLTMPEVEAAKNGTTVFIQNKNPQPLRRAHGRLRFLFFFFAKGSHQFQSPKSFIRLGTSMRRIIVASIATAIAIPTPICFTGITSVNANAPVITIIISAADVMI